MFSTIVLLLLGKLKQFILCFAKLEIFCSIYKCFSRSQGLVPDLHPFCGHQLHHHHLLRLLLHQRGGLEAPLRHRAGGGPHLLRSRVAAIRIHGKQIVEFSQKLLTFFKKNLTLKMKKPICHSYYCAGQSLELEMTLPTRCKP